MSEEYEPEESTEKTADVAENKSGSATLIMRIVLFGILGGLLVYAIIRNQDTTAVNQGIETYNAWQKAIEEADANNEDIYRNDLAQFVKGNPKKYWDKDPDNLGVVSIETYTWEGRYQKFEVEILFGLPEDNPVVVRLEAIEEEPEE